MRSFQIIILICFALTGFVVCSLMLYQLRQDKQRSKRDFFWSMIPLFILFILAAPAVLQWMEANPRHPELVKGSESRKISLRYGEMSHCVRHDVGHRHDVEGTAA